MVQGITLTINLTVDDGGFKSWPKKPPPPFHLFNAVADKWFKLSKTRIVLGRREDVEDQTPEVVDLVIKEKLIRCCFDASNHTLKQNPWYQAMERSLRLDECFLAGIVAATANHGHCSGIDANQTTRGINRKLCCVHVALKTPQCHTASTGRIHSLGWLVQSMRNNARTFLDVSGTELADEMPLGSHISWSQLHLSNGM
uniref:Uncharacterized protein n=1 Tax=Timema cristinae TaxID=61476 RepID=A0A7R9CYP3_TIMCR|nr:unnamed protein product [Timema cristinae]